MPDLIKIFLIFLLIVFLLKKKLNIGFVMLIAASALFMLYQMSLSFIGETCKDTVMNPVTIKLVLALSFIRVFEMILREHAILNEMMNSVKALIRNKKLVIISMPLLIGIIPSVGGAYFSAPMVAETTKDLNISPEEKGFINYWYRHPWEFILPLYPGILLASALSKIELHNLISVNITFAILILITGFFLSMRNIKGNIDIDIEKNLSKKGLWSFVPILSVLLLVAVLHIELHYALSAVVIFLLVFFKYKLKYVIKALKHGFSPDVIILILGVMLFKEAMESSGAVKNLSEFFIKEGIPLFPILFILPFITGLLTGITVGFVGSTFPFIASLTGSYSTGIISFAFASGFIGVLLSPVHVCLILTREYFKADLWGMYKKILPGCLIIFCAAIIKYLLLK
ncbi:MAG: DUF401 family protein [Nitrospirae bacterium]|nr:DUF401 family protein [Nitrospirota bacterium]